MDNQEQARQKLKAMFVTDRERREARTARGANGARRERREARLAQARA